MSVVLLNGASSPTDTAHSLCTEVERQVGARLETVRTFHLAGYDIGRWPPPPAMAAWPSP